MSGSRIKARLYPDSGGRPSGCPFEDLIGTTSRCLAASRAVDWPGGWVRARDSRGFRGRVCCRRPRTGSLAQRRIELASCLFRI